MNRPDLRTLAALSLLAGSASCTCWRPVPSETRELTSTFEDPVFRDTGLQPADALAGDPGACEDLCCAAYEREFGWECDAVLACELDASEGRDGTVSGRVTCEVEGVKYYCKGRPPVGLVAAEAVEGSELGRALAHYGWLEAAAVVAFEELADALQGLSAPAALVARCRAAADEERRHARMMGALAARHGVAVPPVRVDDPGPRDLLTLARLNATVGCVYETWGVVEAAAAAERVADPAVRAVLERIAADELGHAELSWDLHLWFLSQLDEAGRAEVLAVQRAACRDLPAWADRSLHQTPEPLRAGSRDEVVAMASRLAEGLLAA